MGTLNKKYDIGVLIQKFHEKHKFKYTYDNFTDYKNQASHIDIKCNKCQDIFKQKINNHLNGTGCPRCGKNKKPSLGEIKLKFKKVHGNNFNYDEVLYKNAKTKVKIKCNKCDKIFLKTPDKHLQGEGCSFCVLMYNTYKKSDWIKKAKDKKGTFYIIKCWNENEEFYKLGITFNTVFYRYKKTDTQRMPYKYKIVKEIKSFDLNYIWELEKRFKTLKKKQHYTPLIPFKGSVTECFKQ